MAGQAVRTCRVTRFKLSFFVMGTGWNEGSPTLISNYVEFPPNLARSTLELGGFLRQRSRGVVSLSVHSAAPRERHVRGLGTRQCSRVLSRAARLGHARN